MLDRVNRIVLGVVGLLLLAAGVVGILGANGSLRIEQPGVLYRRVARNATANPDQWKWSAVGGGAVLALVCLFWAWRQIRPRGEGRIGNTVLARTGRGKTSVEAVAVARAVAKDLRTVPGVTAAKVRMVSIDTRPECVARLGILDDADPEAVRTATEEPFARLCQALAVDAVDVDLRLRPTDERSSRVI